MADSDREKWDARHAAAAPPGPAPAWLAEHEAALPRRGLMLDVAAGAGRLSAWASDRGLSVTAVDVSAVGLATLRERVPGARTVVRDLELEPRLPRGPYALVACFHYRQPSLWPAMIAVLGRGGVLVAELATVTNLERHERPSKRWLAERGELESLAAGLEILLSEEGWHHDRHTARLIARKPREVDIPGR